jgi:glycosyltransferase involved in cell wall biosynthesis
MMIDSKKATVVENAVDIDFQEFFQKTHINPINLNKKVNIFCPAAAFEHKALHIIPNIAKELKALTEGKIDFSFCLTIDKSSRLWSEIYSNCLALGVCKNVETIGSCNYFQVRELYDGASIVFIPSILETFTATYIEAFISKTPLVVSNLDFSREICQDAAIYVNISRYKESALKFIKLIRDQDLQLSLITQGIGIAQSQIDQSQRYSKIINVLKLHM